MRILLPILVFSISGLSAVQAAAESPGCICDCVYTRTDKIRSHSYFESENLSCNAIEGKACLGIHRGETFRGTIRNCDEGPRGAMVSASPIALSAQMNAEFQSALARSIADGMRPQ